MSGEYLRNLSVADRTKRWEEWFAGNEIVMLVAENGDRILGFVSFGRCRDDDVDASTGEVYAIYLLAEAQGNGLGRNLWKAALQCLRDGGSSK